MNVKYSYTEMTELRNKSAEFLKKAMKEKNRLINVAGNDIREFVDEFMQINPDSQLYKAVINDIESGEKPSVVIEKRLGRLFNGIILPRRKDCILYFADNCCKWAYADTDNIARRSFHTDDTRVFGSNIMHCISFFIQKDMVDKEFTDILKGRLTEEEQAYTISSWAGLQSYEIAYEIDRGNMEFTEEIKDILDGNSEADIDRDIILGILQSSNAELHKLLGKLLLAARLQEGLRQVICESADMGTIEGFMEILSVIHDNNLIRFSSVKRAYGVWTGLIADLYDSRSSDLERISKKSEELIYSALTDEKIRQEYLVSEDSMKIYIALWAYGVYEVHDTILKIKQLSESGSHHQKLTAGYAVHNFCSRYFRNNTAKLIVKSHTEQNILAVYMPSLMPNVEATLYNNTRLSVYNNKNDYKKRLQTNLREFFTDNAEAEIFYDILKKIYSGIKGKAVEFSPCVFPWHVASLSKEDVAVRMMWIANALDDDEKIDEVLDYLSDLTNIRSRMIRLLLTCPRTEKQKRVLTERVCDKESYSRKEAYNIIVNTDISDENYLLLEDMLRYKNSEMRSNIISLLMKRNDDSLYKAIARLISDKKEEKRTAALDMILQLGANKARRPLYEKCRQLTYTADFVTTKEKILAEQIAPTEAKTETAPEPLYNAKDTYTPAIDMEYIARAKTVFEKYFYHKNFLDKLVNRKQDFEAATEKLMALIEAHGDDEFLNRMGETTTLSSGYIYYSCDENGNITIPLQELWDDFYEKEIGSPVLAFRGLTALLSEGDYDEFAAGCSKVARKLIGDEFTHGRLIPHIDKLIKVYEYYIEKHCDKEEKTLIAAYLAYLLSKEDLSVCYTAKIWNGTTELRQSTVIRGYQFSFLLLPLLNIKKNRKVLFPICYSLQQAKGFQSSERNMYSTRMSFFHVNIPCYNSLNTADYLNAAFDGIITEGYMYRHFMSKLENRNTPWTGTLSVLSNLAIAAKEIKAEESQQHTGFRVPWDVTRAMSDLTGKNKPENLTDTDKALIDFAYKAYDKLTTVILYDELRRGDSETRFSNSIYRINRIFGAEYYVKILAALGSETLSRKSYSSGFSKKESLSHLLSVCVPNDDDNAEKLKALVKSTDITDERLIEAAMYSPEWLDITEEYLGWEGLKSTCYYFMAHMNERFDNKREAIIKKYTPLSASELNNGAFDVEWFRSAYASIGAKRFNLVYNAAKYISDGAKHSRARKYADAALGKMKPEETKEAVADKRNKDLLMAYAIIPITDDRDMLERYLYLQQFLKESRKFGSQRSASEKLAVETAMKNLATNAGYDDVTRLTLRMETRLIEENRSLLEDKQVGEVTVRLLINETGKTEIICQKDGKRLKSIPAKLKKEEYIVLLNSVKKSFNDQYSRTRTMFEQSMEDGTEYTFAELQTLFENPVVNPIIKNLVFLCGEKTGYLCEKGIADYNGELTALEKSDKLKAAHPYNLYADKSWAEYQRDLFSRGIVQPFKQVFRELYVKTAEELEMKYSLRYAGNQIQPQKTTACLKSRRWTADVENGLQKVYYKENITARIFARADWFTPSDIEAPTLEWVEFSDRLTGRLIETKNVPDIVFSEVMRDVDLAVSVAHAGGVDPETSHSTVEMRAALLSFTLPLFRLTNVEIKGSHAHITGKRGDYSLHLGSGVVHQKGGTMISILPVHSQHKGKLFLPFADDDPKTAEIISKALLLAEDSKIKDPTILSQLNR